MGDDKGGPLDLGKVWTAETLAQAEGFNPSRVRQLCLEGRFPGARKLGKAWIIPDDDVQAWREQDRDRRFKHWQQKDEDDG